MQHMLLWRNDPSWLSRPIYYYLVKIKRNCKGDFAYFFMGGMSLALHITFLITLMVSALWDIRCRRIPSEVLWFSAVCGLVLSWGRGGLIQFILFPLRTFIGFVPFVLLFRVGALGGGDGKLLGLGAGYFGLKAYVRIALWSLLLGAVYGLVRMLLQRSLISRLRCFIGHCRRAVLCRTWTPYDVPVQDRNKASICFSGAVAAGFFCYLFF